MTKKKSPNIFSGKNARITPAPKRSHKKKVSVDFNKPVFFRVEEGPVNLVNSISKPATILYKKLPDDMILITGFDGFLSLDEIFDKYGRVIAATYAGYICHMFGVSGNLFLSGLGSTTGIAIGKLLHKEELSEIIAHVKKCGGLLHDIIQACEKGEVKRIEI
jgi:hypothetical protein